MTAFLISLAVLVVGYIGYGYLVDRVMGTSKSAQVPAYTKRDDVDYRPMATWRVFLIQFLNIAGLGPIFGAIMGIMYGPAAFLWISLGTIFAGGVHDYFSGVISLRMGGASLPEIIGAELGNGVKQLIRGFSVLLLVLVTAVFVITPADLLSSITPDWLDVTIWTCVIFAYYILATLLPIDKLIGNLYPVFGFSLLFMAVGLLVVLLSGDVRIPVSFSEGFGSRTSAPVFPMMFVSIACGAISGFHATQSPMMARCMKNEKLARPIFYGAMVAEGIVALIWAAAAVAFTHGYSGLSGYLASPEHSPGTLVHEIAFSWLGTAGGILALLGVIVAPISTGDTALRSARLTVADFMNISQRRLWPRIMVAFPLIAIVAVIMLIDFDVLWRYFAWSNQTLAVFTLWAITVYLARRGKPYIVSLIPALFMTSVTSTYLLAAPRPEGFGADYTVAVGVGGAITAICGVWFFINLFSRNRRI